VKAEILSIGTELLLGDILNTNAKFLAQELAGAGVEVYHQSVVGDNPGRLREQLERSFARSQLVITTGGLGPTYDDLSKETAAAFFGRKLVEDKEILCWLEERFRAIGCPMTDNNRKQALIPEGAQALANPNGTAPGIWMEDGGRILVLLPGPPREMEPMFQNEVLPRLQQATGKVICSSTIHLFGIGESAVEDRLRPMMVGYQNPTVAPYAKQGEVQLRITAMAESREAARQMIAPVRQEICDSFGQLVYGVDVGSLQNALVQTLLSYGRKVATAESCTGGMVSQRITQIPGSSGVFDCGVCTYANRIKHQLVGVSGEDLERYGAVSEPVALQMARGVRALSGADIGISTTGIAGPDGGSPEKPVGLVYVGVSSEGYEEVLRLNLQGRGTDARDDIRYRASSHALHLALKAARRLGPKEN